MSIHDPASFKLKSQDMISVRPLTRGLHWCLDKLLQNWAGFIFPTCVLLLRGTQITADGTSCKETWGRSFRRAGGGGRGTQSCAWETVPERFLEREHSQKSPSLLTGKQPFPQVWKYSHVFSYHFFWTDVFTSEVDIHMEILLKRLMPGFTDKS